MAFVSVGSVAVFGYLVVSLPASVPSSQVTGAPVLVVIPMLALVAVGLMLSTRVPSNAVGWVVGGGVLALGLLLVSSVYVGRYQYAHDLPAALVAPMAILDTLAWSIGFPTLLILLPMLFPNGHPVSRRWRIGVWLAGAAMLFTAVTSLLGLAVNGLYVTVEPTNLSAPQAIVSILEGPVSGVFMVLLIASAVVSLVVRHRRADEALRQQLKWFIAAVVVAASSSIPILIGLSSTLTGVAVALGMSLIPLSIAVAVLRHRLYDIDIIISRALAYGALAVVITAVYVVIVVGIGPLIESGGRWNLGLSIAATVVMAIVLQPVRERLERTADRLVYGRRATPYEVLSQFSRRVAESYSGADMLERMATLLGEGTGAELAEVWLHSGSALVRVAAWPAQTAVVEPVLVDGGQLPSMEAGLAVAVRHQAELLGALTITKRRGETMSPIEDKLVADLAGQAGLVLKNVGLNAELVRKLDELRASRQRLVEAQDGERRRIERNIHDGAQQHLVAIKIKLGLITDLAGRDPAAAITAVDDLKADADAALQNLRDLARGIYPPLLADQGLESALSAQARRATVPVIIDVAGIGRLAPEVEGAVYFCCLEALQNVQKYAEASRVVVRLWRDDGRLNFEVVDDGRGFDPAHAQRGTGFTSMQDRLDALGGSVKVTSEPGQGTHLIGRLPLS